MQFTPVSTDKYHNESHLQQLDKTSTRGRIELIMGTMFSGKSTELLKRTNLAEISGKKVMRVKFAGDIRFENINKIITHSGLSHDAVPVNKLLDLGETWRNYDVIGIDEGQFFTDIVEFADKAANENKMVVITSL